MDDEHDTDGWERAGQTLDWVAGLLATRFDRDPVDLVWPTVGLGLAAGLGAEAVSAAAGAETPMVLVGVTLTVCGFGMLALLAMRFRRRGGSAPTAEADLLAPWLRRLQVLLSAVLVAVLGLLVVGAVVGSPVLVGRNTLELGRVGAVVLAISFLLLDDEVGRPAWLARWAREPAEATTRS